MVVDVESMSLVHELKEWYDYDFASELLTTMDAEESTEIVKEAENIICKDHTLLLKNNALSPLSDC